MSAASGDSSWRNEPDWLDRLELRPDERASVAEALNRSGEGRESFDFLVEFLIQEVQLEERTVIELLRSTEVPELPEISILGALGSGLASIDSVIDTIARPRARLVQDLMGQRWIDPVTRDED
jgi:hypothetical protein